MRVMDHVVSGQRGVVAGLAVLCWLMPACSGPVPLQIAILPEDRVVYDQAMGGAGDAMTAWLEWKARQDGISPDAARERDARLSTSSNPFRASSDRRAVSLGALIFEQHCVRCHGAEVRGNGPDMLAEHPCKDFHAFGKRFAVTLHGGAPRSWFSKIQNGHGEIASYPTGAGPAMPAFGSLLAREQIWLAITYLQSLDIHVNNS